MWWLSCLLLRLSAAIRKGGKRGGRKGGRGSRRVASISLHFSYKKPAIEKKGKKGEGKKSRDR